MIPFGIKLNRTCLTAAISLGAWIVLASAALAGYPDVAQEGSTLYIVGDDDANTVTIVGAEDTPGKLAVYVHKDPWIYEGVDEIDIEAITRHGDAPVFYVVGSHAYRRKNVLNDSRAKRLQLAS